MRISQTFITGAILLGAGAYNTYKDYLTAPQEQKARTLTRNITALGAAAVAVVSADRFLSSKFSSEVIQNFSHNVSNRILKNKYVQKISSKLFPKKQLQPVKLEALADMVANCTKDVTLTATAALAGITSGLCVDKILSLSKKADIQAQKAELQTQQIQQKQAQAKQLILPKRVHNILENPMMTKVANDKTKNLIMNTTKVFEAAGLITNPFEMPSVIMGSLDMAKEKNLQKIVEQTSSGIVAEALIPTFFISLTNSLTKNKSAWIKIPAIAASFCVGDFVGEKVGAALTHEIRDEIFDIEEEENVSNTSSSATANAVNNQEIEEDEENEND